MAFCCVQTSKIKNFKVSKDGNVDPVEVNRQIGQKHRTVSGFKVLGALFVELLQLHRASAMSAMSCIVVHQAPANGCRV